MKTVLGIDFGTKRVGLAVSRATLAEPLNVITNDDTLFENLKSVCEQHEIAQIVVGLSESTMAEQTREFVTELKQYINLPVVFQDETLSSYQVLEKLKRVGKISPGQRKPVIDHFAAAEILQEWLDTHELS